jgi:tRNA modification GTPase
MDSRLDTIAAIATPPGSGGIAVLRVSGPSALTVLRRLFRPVGVSGNVADFVFRPRFMHFGTALDVEGLPLDDVLAVHMPGPHSATGEDVGEIHCHGGRGVTTALIEAAFAAGARPAGPGEFTRRAFLHGRIDLTQAEAVAEIVAAAATQGARLARAKLEGALGTAVKGIARHLEACRSQIILAVDFPEEDAELLRPEAFTEAIAEARRAVETLLAGFHRARLWREGAAVVLAGQVNAGKSSLLNALLGRQRAIVSPLPGTTRDYIEEPLHLDGLPVRLIDTAGLRPSGDIIEEEGMRLAHELAAQADALVLVVDALKGFSREDEEFFARHADRIQRGALLVALNKEDALPPVPSGESPGALLSGVPRGSLPHAASACLLFRVSARTGAGIASLASGIRAAVLLGQEASAFQSPEHGDIAPNLRQSQLLRQADEELAALARDHAAGLPPDILGVRLDAAADLLAQITGAVENEALLDAIFSTFCIGK